MLLGLLLGLLLGFHDLFCSLTRNNLSTADDITILVEDFAFIVESLSSQVFRVTFGDLAERIAVRIQDVSILLNFEAFENVEIGEGQSIRGLACEILRFVWKDLSAADNISVFVKDLSIVADGLSNEVFRVSLHDFS